MKINVTLFFLLLATVVFPQDRPLTVAESSNFMSTSTYNDVLGFIDTLVADYSNVRVENIAETVQGRKIPLLVLGNPLPANPDELNGRIAIYIQANIHAGEVEG
ncbi:MAG TPA: M14 family zinc carboxypeptidase, partial [Tenuifilaceae bacterium]|nr:M14 family zinc carboxypeptidase [Tenuifilaceae bacterium]